MTREIKGPEDCKPHTANLFTEEGSTLPIPNGVFTAQEVGQIIALAMDAERNLACLNAGLDSRDKAQNDVEAWRELAERLRGK